MHVSVTTGLRPALRYVEFRLLRQDMTNTLHPFPILTLRLWIFNPLWLLTG